jgi:hypothetical protein
MTRNLRLTLILASLAPFSAASAQMPSLGQLGGSGGTGLSGVANSLLPKAVGSTGVSNAAGLLGYCVQNKLLGGASAANASSVLGQLTGRQDVTKSPNYALGQQGTLKAGNGQTFSLDQLKGQVKQKACDMVLSRAGSFL